MFDDADSFVAEPKESKLKKFLHLLRQWFGTGCDCFLASPYPVRGYLGDLRILAVHPVRHEENAAAAHRDEG